MSDNALHEMRLIQISNLRPRYQKITCAYCMHFLSTKYRCSGCQSVYYCSQHCQEQDWSVHSKVCQQQQGEMPNQQFCFVQVPCVEPCAQLCFSSVNEQNAIVKFYFDQQELVIRDGTTNFFSCLRNNALRVQQYNDQAALLSNYEGFYSSHSHKYENLCLECQKCQKACQNNQQCSNCGQLNQIDDEIFMSLSRQALVYLLNIQNQPGLINKYFPGTVLQANDEFAETAINQLVTNNFYHLSLPVLYVCLRLLQLYPNFKCNILYKILYVCVKGSKFHFGFNDQLLKILLKIARVSNYYSLNELEKKAPQAMREYNEQVESQLTDEQYLQIQKIAVEQQELHQKALEFANQAREMTDKIGDEALSREVDNIIGQIDGRIENLESWIYYYQNDEEYQDLKIQGTQYNADDNSGGKVDLFK